MRTIIRIGHPHLRRMAKEMTIEEILSAETQTLIADMFETMKAAEGIGLAAPQIDVSYQLAIIHIPTESQRYPGMPPSEQLIIINPKMTILDPSLQGYWEGCLSVPGLKGHVERPRKIKIDYLDQNASPQSIIASDFLATVFQHELDHLFGIVYIDRMTDTTKLSFNEEFTQFLRPSLANTVED